MAVEEEERGRGFRVEDKRRFDPTSGEPRPSEEGRRQPQEQGAAKRPEPQNTPRPETPPRATTTSLPEISFSSFILGLTTQALIYMGEVPSAPGQPVRTDLSAAQQMIDVIAMLKQKTAGNLDAGEEAMLGNALYDLRMRYVELVKRHRETVEEREKP